MDTERAEDLMQYSVMPNIMEKFENLPRKEGHEARKIAMRLLGLRIRNKFTEVTVVCSLSSCVVVRIPNQLLVPMIVKEFDCRVTRDNLKQVISK